MYADRWYDVVQKVERRNPKHGQSARKGDRKKGPVLAARSKVTHRACQFYVALHRGLTQKVKFNPVKREFLRSVVN